MFFFVTKGRFFGDCLILLRFLSCALSGTTLTDVGIRNLSAYMRKMALNGYVLHVDLAPVKEIVSLQRRCANNLNQIAVRVNTCGGVYPEEIKTLQKDYTDLWGPLSELLEKLSEVVAL